MSSIDTFIAESITRPLPDTKPRVVHPEVVPGMASVITGMRRSGKTYLLFREMRRLMETGVDKSRILYVNFEDDRLYPMRESILSDILESFYRQTDFSRNEKVYVFLDEIQAVDGWSRFARRVLDTETVTLYLTGSSARMLSSEVATEFRGRGYVTELLPLSFVEYIQWKSSEGIEPPYSSPVRSAMEKHFSSYLREGGFPAVQGLSGQQRIQILQSYVELVILRDVIERHDLGNPSAVRAFTMTLLQSSASLMSVNKIYRDLTSRGIRVGKESLYDLLEFLADAFLLSAVSRFDRSLRVRQSNPRKVYTIDPGLAFAYSPSGTSNTGRRLEEAVFLELRRRTAPARPGEICYYITRSGKEVDFVHGDPVTGKALQLTQVSASIREEKTRKRELEALDEAMEEMGMSESTLITLFDEGQEKTRFGTVNIIPGWKWFLDSGTGGG